MKIVESSLRLLLTGVALLASPLHAQTQAQTGALDDRGAAGRALSLHLNTLSTDTHNVHALIGAGEAALALDDPNGAIGFFGRADEVDPRNGRVKAGLARALLMLEKPREALRLFDQAAGLGVSEAEIARDRGLAYDLRGDQKRAQRDYMLAMRRGDDPEATRRMALSLGISGDREQALKLLDPLLYKQDKAAWRARAFVLAMSGDVDGANGIARQVMPGNLARPMGYFFTRLGGLSPAQKAAAVHYGQMPSDGRSDGLVYAQAEPTHAPAPAVGNGLIPAGNPLGPRAGDPVATRQATPPSTEPRRRPGQDVRLASVTAAQAAQAPASQAPALTAQTSAGVTRSGPVADTASRRIETRLNARIGPVPSTPPAATTTPPAGAIVLTGMTDLPAPSPAQPSMVSSETAAAIGGAPVATDYSLPAPGFATDPAPTPAPPASVPPVSSTLASIVGALELEEPVIVPPPVPQPRKAAAPGVKPAVPGRAAEEKKPDARKPADKKAADKKVAEKKARPDPKKAEPARIWAQVLTGSDKAALGRDYQKMVKKTPTAFKGKTAWTAPYRSSRRLLVGPFDSQKQAQDFLAKAGVRGFAWTSAVGEAVEKLPLK